jgi:ribonuclease HII
VTWKRQKIPARKRKMTTTKAAVGPLDKILEQLQPEYIIGIDEVGWGAIAGPLVVACAVFKPDWKHLRVRDSKTYTSDKARERAFVIVQESSAYVGYQEASAGNLEVFGPGQMLQQSFLILAQRAISHFPNSLVVIDGSNKIAGLEHNQVCLAKADKLIPAVSAASIAAKVSRDHTMIELGKSFPEYEWYANKGYGTPKHMDAMKKVGVSVHHRRNIQSVLDYEKKYGTYERYRS